jgi:fibrillarin-like pre-rRNA processing protein
MKETKTRGIFKDKNRIFTENPPNCKGLKIYNEKLVKYKNKEFRSWNPYRSKLATAILNGLDFEIKPDSKVLYLGAATGTTVSHISDILKNGMIYAVENSPVAMNKLIQVCEKRQNIVPILADANHPDRYSHIVPSVDMVYQDISQRNQAEIFIENANKFLKKKGKGILMVKARSIDVSMKPKDAYDTVCSKLMRDKLQVVKKIDLSPFEKDHSAIMTSF